MLVEDSIEVDDRPSPMLVEDSIEVDNRPSPMLVEDSIRLMTGPVQWKRESGKARMPDQPLIIFRDPSQRT